MHLFSAPVLLAAALISSPALWSGLIGQGTLQWGLSRYLMAVALSWAALSMVAMLVGPIRPRAVVGAHDGPGEDRTDDSVGVP